MEKKKRWTKEQICQLNSQINSYSENKIKWENVKVEGKTIKQCKTRINHTKKNKKSKWSEKEDEVLLSSVRDQKKISNKINWARISEDFENRCDKQCKNRWYYLRKEKWNKEDDKELLKYINDGNEYDKQKLSVIFYNKIESNVKKRYYTLKKTIITNK